MRAVDVGSGGRSLVATGGEPMRVSVRVPPGAKKWPAFCVSEPHGAGRSPGPGNDVVRIRIVDLRQKVGKKSSKHDTTN